MPGSRRHGNLTLEEIVRQSTNKALLAVDVWEHAYYIDYRNLRLKFVETFLDKLVDWRFAEDRFA